ncbi:MAG: thiamine pyrophosphate-binding protein [Lentisphaerae bacterium]|nr:thiamine pyrophosphate-binding protein [Lentisphaerota bacterium]
MEKVSDYIFRIIHEQTTVRTVFMLPGGGCMHLLDSLGRSALRYVCNLHEQAAAIAAEAYAQYNGDLGVVLVTAGPGSTNAITGVAGAWIDSTPLLVLSGQAKTSDLRTRWHVRQMGIQEVDTVNIVSPFCKYAVCITDPQRVPYELGRALHLARSGRKGPVWLDIPLDVQGASIDPATLPAYQPEPPERADYQQAAREILSALSVARRPVVYAGNGIRLSGALKEFRQWVEMTGLPVLTSWKAADFLPEEHPQFVGRPGIIAQRGANFVQQTADCLLALGTRLDLCQTGFNHPGFAPRAQKYIVDIDGCEIDKLDMPLAGKYALDAGKLLRALIALTAEYTFSCQPWLSRCKDWQRRYPVILPEYCREDADKVNLYHLIKVLSEVMQPGQILVPGSSGACAEVTMQAFQVKEGERIQNTPGLGSMGFGLPACIGACLASGGKLTVAIIGDGGLQHNIQELQTLKNLNLPIKLFVLNNGGYGSIVNMQKNRFQGHFVACNPESGLILPELQRLAEAYRLPFARIAHPRNLQAQVADILNQPGTTVCEVMLDPNVVSAPHLASEALPDGRMVSKPMEDLAPFLSRAELAENLSVE